MRILVATLLAVLAGTPASAQVDFTEGSRFLVNARRFEDLNPTYKEDVSRIYQMKRQPASADK